MSNHVILLGDSIFDNASYVPGGPPVIQQLAGALPAEWRATLLAIDGATIESAHAQFFRLPVDATHLVISAGGNNALKYLPMIVDEVPTTFPEALRGLDAIGAEFQPGYRKLLERALGFNRPTVVCTIYDAVPDLDPAARAALCGFNDVILREAARAGVPVVDLRLICTERGDYSALSPIEPSVAGGEKIARAVARAVTGHDFVAGGCRIFC